jgi:hypothetical protein
LISTAPSFSAARTAAFTTFALAYLPVAALSGPSNVTSLAASVVLAPSTTASWYR